jgi:hypothetical protein
MQRRFTLRLGIAPHDATAVSRTEQKQADLKRARAHSWQRWWDGRTRRHRGLRLSGPRSRAVWRHRGESAQQRRTGRSGKLVVKSSTAQLGIGVDVRPKPRKRKAPGDSRRQWRHSGGCYFTGVPPNRYDTPNRAIWVWLVIFVRNSSRPPAKKVGDQLP